MKKRILILGNDGYIGHPLTMRLLKKGHIVSGIDNGSRRQMVSDIGNVSATDIFSQKSRRDAYTMMGDYTGYDFDIVRTPGLFRDLIAKKKFDVIVNLAHNPSASYSMISKEQADSVLINNILGTNALLWAVKESCPDTHIISIGSTGEYNHGINVDIEEGYFTFDHNNRTSVECLFPRQANSIYHASKVASTYLIDYCSRIWNLRCTDVMQSVVYGTWTPEVIAYRDPTRLDTDDCFGTVFNRFVVQALLGEPLTVFGNGEHKRGFLALNDSLQALEIAINNPAEPGKVQTWNQLSEWYSMNEVADKVLSIIPGTKVSIPSPRKEKTDTHYYNYKTDILKGLGYEPTRTMEQEIEYMKNSVKINDKSAEILKKFIQPKVNY